MSERPRWWRRLLGSPQAPDIPEPLWQDLLQQFDFLAQRPPQELARLRELSREFLARKEFSGAHGLVVSDAMALAIAA